MASVIASLARYAQPKGRRNRRIVFMLLLLNWIVDPTRKLLNKLDASEYHALEADVAGVEVRS